MATVDQAAGKEASETGCLVLLRHGQTAWSLSGQYTGRTDIPLTEEGERQAAAAGVRLSSDFPEGFDAGCVFVSPLMRARQTARLSGFDRFEIMPELVERDYGHAEGRRRRDIQCHLGRDWDVWTDDPSVLTHDGSGDRQEVLPDGSLVQVRVTGGESLAAAAARTRGIIERVAPLVDEGRRVLLVSHAHILRVLATQWMGLDPSAAKLMRLYTAHYGVLGNYQGDRVLKTWNC